MAHSNAWCSISAVYYMSHWCRQEEHPAKIVPVHKKVTIEGLRERTKHLDIFLFFPPSTQWCSISDVLFTGGRGVSDFSVLKYY